MKENSIELKYVTLAQLKRKIELYDALVNVKALGGVDGYPHVCVEVAGEFKYTEAENAQESLYIIKQYVVIDENTIDEAVLVLQEGARVELQPTYDVIERVKISTER